MKPEYFTHPAILPLSPWARLVFISLWTQADDEGRLYDQPRRIGGNALGDGDEPEIEELLAELSMCGRIVRYRVNGRKCIQIKNFREHQPIPPTKFRPSQIPACDTVGVDLPSGSEDGSARAQPSSSAQSSPPSSDVSPDTATQMEGNGREQGMEGNRTKGADEPRPKNPTDIQAHLLTTVQRKDERWKKFPWSALVQLNGRFGRPVVTMALQRVAEELPEIQSAPYPLFEAICRDVAAREAS